MECRKVRSDSCGTLFFSLCRRLEVVLELSPVAGGGQSAVDAAKQPFAQQSSSLKSLSPTSNEFQRLGASASLLLRASSGSLFGGAAQSTGGSQPECQGRNDASLRSWGLYLASLKV